MNCEDCYEPIWPHLTRSYSGGPSPEPLCSTCLQKKAEAERERLEQECEG
jgi:hypothetical protein